MAFTNILHYMYAMHIAFTKAALFLICFYVNIYILTLSPIFILFYYAATEYNRFVHLTFICMYVCTYVYIIDLH